jgi:hypothetical protein
VGLGVGLDRSADGCSILTPTPGPLRDKLADATGYPLPASPILRQANTRRAISVPLPPVNHGQQRGTVTRPDRRSRPLTTQWAQPSQLAMRVRSGLRRSGPYSVPGLAPKVSTCWSTRRGRCSVNPSADAFQGSNP